MGWILDAVGCSFFCREGSVGPPLKNVMHQNGVRVNWKYGIPLETLYSCSDVDLHKDREADTSPKIVREDLAREHTYRMPYLGVRTDALVVIRWPTTKTFLL
jgi:hypothetical protein